MYHLIYKQNLKIMSEYIKKIIIPTLDGECELSLLHKEYITQSDYNRLNHPSEDTLYIVKGKRIYLGEVCIWKKPKNVLVGLFTKDSDSQNWLVEINGADKSLVEYADLDTREFYLDFDTIKEDLTSIRFGFGSYQGWGYGGTPRSSCLRKVYHMPDTSNVTSFNNLFFACDKLVLVDLSNCNTSNVTSMNSMFSYCTSLTTLNLFLSLCSLAF